jgi:hypothetical protein
MLEEYLVCYWQYQVEGLQYFPCWGESHSHAEEQFDNAYPFDTHEISAIFKGDTEALIALWNLH